MKNYSSLIKAIIVCLIIFMAFSSYVWGHGSNLDSGYATVRSASDTMDIPQDVPISILPGDQGVSAIVSDGAGGDFIFWGDEYQIKVFAQRIDANNQLLWGTNGVAVAPSGGLQYSAGATSDGEGGIIVTWLEGRSPIDPCGPSFFANCDIYAQRIDATGQQVWQISGIPIVIAAGNQGVSGIGIAGDGNGGAFLVWEDGRPDCCRIYAQQIDAAGQTKWNTEYGIPDGIPITSTPSVTPK